MNYKNSGLALHFLLELAAMVSLVHWGTNASQTWPGKLLLGLGMPLAAAVIWGVFRVPDDPGPAPVPIPGPLRLLIELVILGASATALYFSGEHILGLLFAAAIVLDYALMHERVRMLLSLSSKSSN